MPRARKAAVLDKAVIPKELPILPSGDAVAFPAILIPLGTSNEKVVRLIDEAASGDRVVGIFAQRPGTEAPTPENLYSMGTAATIVRMFKMPDGSIRAFLQGQARIRMAKVTRTEPYIKAKVEEIAETAEEGPELEALTQNLVALFRRVVELAPNLPEELNIAVINIP
ncbi:MAG: LON peptidase substrate-binding domain-containing protein, partial [Dehalococcoidia bacterium]